MLPYRGKKKKNKQVIQGNLVLGKKTQGLSDYREENSPKAPVTFYEKDVGLVP